MKVVMVSLLIAGHAVEVITGEAEAHLKESPTEQSSFVIPSPKLGSNFAEANVNFARKTSK